MSALPQLPTTPGALEAHFAPFRANTLGIDQTIETPYGVMPIVYARLFGGNVEYISKAVFLSTLASVLTIPVVIALLK